MRTLLSFAILLSTAMPAFARDMPEPGSLSLVGIATLGMLVALRKKK